MSELSFGMSFIAASLMMLAALIATACGLGVLAYLNLPRLNQAGFMAGVIVTVSIVAVVGLWAAERYLR